MKKYITSGIDGKEYCIANGQFSKHLKENNLTKKEYYLTYIGNYEKCPYCNKEKKFNEQNMYYIKTCGEEPCKGKSIRNGFSTESKNKISDSLRKRWEDTGIRNKIVSKISSAHRKRDKNLIEEANIKRKKTCQEKYGADSIAKIDKFEKKRKQTLKQKYGNECYFLTLDYESKAKKTFNEKYGVDWYVFSDDFVKKMKETKNIKYGDENYTNREKAKNTFIRNYGVDNIFKTESFKEHTKKILQSRYGVQHPMHNQEIKNRIKETCMDRYSAEHPRKAWIDYNFLYDTEKLIDEYSNNGIMGVCNKANSSPTFANKYLRSCGIDVIKQSVSQFEKEVKDFIIEEYGNSIITGDRDVLNGKELDIYIPELKIAFECNGEYWHSELSGKDKNYHLDKTNVCFDKGIKLIHIWYHEWLNYENLIKSRIKSLLGKNRRIYARNTKIKEVTHKTSQEFLKFNHIQGACPAMFRYGLYYKDDLVALMTFGRSRYDKKCDWELLRYCTERNTNIVGGPSKLFKYFLKNNTGSVVSYSDNMRNTGGLYRILGFEEVQTTAPSYYYTKDYLMFENRVAYQKHKLKDKLEHFDPNKTEWQNMIDNGYDRIWDCGTTKWVYKRRS